MGLTEDARVPFPAGPPAWPRMQGDTPDLTEDVCRDLWCAVLFQQLHDAMMIRPTSMATPARIREARHWFGGRDFRAVCALAGLDDDMVLGGYRKRLSDLIGKGTT